LVRASCFSVGRKHHGVELRKTSAILRSLLVFTAEVKFLQKQRLRVHG